MARQIAKEEGLNYNEQCIFYEIDATMDIDKLFSGMSESKLSKRIFFIIYKIRT